MNRQFLNNATPETVISWDYVVATFAPTAIDTVYYDGVLGATVFETYDANTLYFALQMVLNENNATPLNTSGGVLFYDEADVARYNYLDAVAIYNGAAGAFKFFMNPLHFRNVWFSRISHAYYDNMLFVGYKLTIP